MTSIDSFDPELRAEDYPWLEPELKRHQQLAPRAQELLVDRLAQAKIGVLSVTHRVKDRQSAISKIERKQYSNPKRQLTDLTGIRVVTFLEGQVSIVSSHIAAIFNVDPANSSTQDDKLGIDRIGYRSQHFVCSLAQPSTNSNIGGLKFEIQVRTVLQHAWAELAHDNTFKIDIALPDDLQRKLNLHAAMLELVDKGFQEIFDDAEKYRASVAAQSPTDILDAEIDSISLYEYLDRLGSRLAISRLGGELERRVVNEVLAFGLTTIGDLDKLIDQEFIDRYHLQKSKGNTYRGLLRLVLMHHDLERYLRVPHDWYSMMRSTYEMLVTRHGKDRVNRILRSREVDVMD